MHGVTPEYPGSVVRVANLPGRQILRSANTIRPVVPPFKLSKIGRQAFLVTDPQVGNRLKDFTLAPSLSTYRPRLTTRTLQAISSISRSLK